MIKNLIILGLIVVVGALTYSSWRPYIDSFMKKDEVVAPVATTTAPSAVLETSTPAPIQKVEVEKKPVIIDEDGALRDGPFVIRNKDGKDTGATAEIIRSPEEALLQFKDVTFTHSAGTEIRLVQKRTDATYINLGPARLNSGVLIYGMPLDIDLSPFTSLTLYNPDTNVVEYKADLE
jgi:hypothetical protein